MVYYKLILEKKRLKSNGIYSIIVRITYHRKNTTISTGVRVNEQYWDANTQLVNALHPNFQLLNKTLTETYLKIQKAIHQLIDADEFSFEALKAKLTDKPKAPAPTFNSFSKKLIQEMIEIKRTGNAIVYQTAVNRLVNYSDNKDIKFSDIDYNLLEAFKHQLMTEGAKVNTVGNYFRSIRAIYNKAIKAKIAERSLYPFGDIKIKQQKTVKRAIDIQNLKKILATDIQIKSGIWNARNYFFLSFYLRGISFTDLAYLKPENAIQGRLIFKRRKTHKQYDIKLTPEALSIFNIYKGINSEYLLPILSSKVQEDGIEAKKIIHQWIKTTNKYLKRLGEDIGLESPLTTYVARHTWATTAKRLGYSNELIAEAMGHEYGNRVTAIYLDAFDQNEIDVMNQKIILSIMK